MFIVVYTVNLHILCIYDLFNILLSYDTFMDLWNVYVCMCTYVCMYVDGHDEANSRFSQFCKHV